MQKSEKVIYLQYMYAFKNFDIAHNGCGNRPTLVGIASFKNTSDELDYRIYTLNAWQLVLLYVHSYIFGSNFVGADPTNQKVIFGRYRWTLSFWTRK